MSEDSPVPEYLLQRLYNQDETKNYVRTKTKNKSSVYFKRLPFTQTYVRTIDEIFVYFYGC
jgi:hypothetical protein